MGRTASSVEKEKKNLIVKTWERCRSMGGGGGGGASICSLQKTKSWPKCPEGGRGAWVAPEGRVCVRVGPGKERFLIRTEHLNHPIFRTLLEAAGTEYGYANRGPLELPCGVDLLRDLLWEIEQDGELGSRTPLCSFARPYGGGYQPLGPRRTPLLQP